MYFLLATQYSGHWSLGKTNQDSLYSSHKALGRLLLNLVFLNSKKYTETFGLCLPNILLSSSGNSPISLRECPSPLSTWSCWDCQQAPQSRPRQQVISPSQKSLSPLTSVPGPHYRNVILDLWSHRGTDVEIRNGWPNSAQILNSHLCFPIMWDN